MKMETKEIQDRLVRRVSRVILDFKVPLALQENKDQRVPWVQLVLQEKLVLKVPKVFQVQRVMKDHVDPQESQVCQDYRVCQVHKEVKETLVIRVKEVHQGHLDLKDLQEHLVLKEKLEHRGHQERRVQEEVKEILVCQVWLETLVRMASQDHVDFQVLKVKMVLLDLKVHRAPEVFQV